MAQYQERRSRTVTWHDPMPSLRAAQTMSGIDYLKAVQSGDLPPPPITALIGMALVEVSEGRVVFSAEPGEYHYNPLGTVHGGIAATLLDSAMGCAVQSLLAAGTGYTTLEIKVNYLRPITSATGTVTCEGTIIHLGGRIATAQARLTDATGKLYAHGTMVVTLIAERGRQRSGEATGAFATPNVVHFCAALLIAAILSVLWNAGLLLGICDLAGE